MRPLLHPALVTVWRDPSTVQFGLSPDRAVVIGGLDPRAARTIGRLDGFHTLDGLHEVARAEGCDRATVESTVTMLREHGVLVDADESGLTGPDPAASLAVTDAALAPDRVSAALVDGTSDTGMAAMTVRAAGHVHVVGGGRVGASVARLLAAAGIGLVTCDDDRVAGPGDVHPGGLDRTCVGSRRGHAVAERLSAARASTSAPPPPRSAPRLVVIAPDPGTGRTAAADLVRAGIPHLLVRIDETTGVVGPLVVPGRTSCLRCHDLHRTDRDPGWPTVLLRADTARPAVPACDVALAAMVAGLAAAQVLGHLAGDRVAAVDGTIETTLPHALPRRRTWSAHPACGCQWTAGDGTE